ncbi:MAG TPA: AAA family ATPase, partial [Longimicrobiales bacterium]|nr:AAA family ATPase [Longimicrobiales bacterium]
MSASNPTQAFVGRRAELADLHGRLKHALDGHGGLVAVTGEPGAGKTTLIDRFLVEAVLQRPDLRIITTYCSEQYGADEPYQPFLEAFRDLVAGTQKPLPVRELAKQLAPAWLQAVPIAGDLLAAAAATVVEFRRKRGTQSAAGSAQTLRDVAAELAPQWLQAIPIAGQLMAAATSTAVDLGQLGNAKAGRAAVSEESLFHQYTELFLTAAEHSPILLVIDDVHWADRASVALLTHLTRQIAARRALVLITYRPADVEAQQHPILPALDALGKAALLTSIALGTFGEGDVAELLREQLDGEVDDELISWLGQRSNGNPLFLTELMRWLVEAGYARERRGEWQLARRPSDVEVPRSAESVIDKRLARLDPASYRLLEYASVEGDQFHLAA